MLNENRPVEILLVEDNPGDERLTREALKEGKVYSNLHWVKDGVEALDFLRREACHSAQGYYLGRPADFAFDEDGKPLQIPGIVPRLSETPGETRWLGPALGEHTAEILGRLGYSREDQDKLKQRGVI